ncbi:MAG TPA: hypothetical protein VJB66_00985 [Candidatus Nanoarchaeia archaeon]|nr:hypothetical protein [Candidatus Nanoarchaeia archaeon]
MNTHSLDTVIDEIHKSEKKVLSDSVAVKSRVKPDEKFTDYSHSTEYDPTDTAARQRARYEKPGYAKVLASDKLLIIPDKRFETTAAIFSLTSAIEKKEYADSVQPEKKEAKYDSHQIVQTLKAVIFEASARTGAALPPQAREQVAAAMNCQHDGPILRGLAESESHNRDYNLNAYLS